MKIKRIPHVILIGLFLYSCSIETAEKKGPNDSWWLGGSDGGVFLKIQDDENPGDAIYKGIIYFDGDQRVWYEGKFELKGELNFKPEEKSLYEFWDGEKLYLIDGAYLQPTSPIPPL